MTPLVNLTIAWLLGIALAQWLVPRPTTLLLLAIPAISGLLLYRGQPRFRAWAINAIVLLLGAARLLSSQPTITPDHVVYYNDTDYVTFTARVVDEPDLRDTYTNLRVQAKSIALPNTPPRPVEGLVLVRAPRYPEYQFGDTLEIHAKLETPPIFERFSYKDYLARQGIHSFVRRPRIKLLAAQHGLSLRAAIFRFKAYAHQTVNRILSEPEAGLLNGILLGIQSGIPRALYDQFNATGASHVIVISGSNISLLVGILLLAGQKLIGRRRATWLALAGVALYTVMVGADAAVVRAAIMGALFVLAMYLGRPNAVLNALFASALAMTLANPLTLWDVGFQLSFLATLGLVVLVPPLETLTERIWSSFGHTGGLTMLSALLKEAMLVTIAAQVITTPLIIYQFGRLSLVSLLTNLLIVPVQPLIMLLGGAATLVGMISQLGGTVLGWLAWLPLAWTIWMVQWTAGFRWAQLNFPALPFWLMSLSYLTLAVGVWWLNERQQQSPRRYISTAPPNRAIYTAGGAVALLIFLWAATRSLPDGKLHVAFLDVGQGDAILVTTPHGRQLLIDGGPSPSQLEQRLSEEMPFWDHSLDVVVSTHPDADHLTGLVDVAQRYTIGTVLVSDVSGTSALSTAWQRELSARHLNTITAWQKQRLQLDSNVEADVLNPGPATQTMEPANDHSVTLKIQMGQVSFLLSGDLEAAGEQALLLEGEDVQATVLKSPHHGSKTGSSALFLQAVNPQVVVISVGANNRFGHPAPEILQRYADFGISVLRTDKQGTVELVTDGEKLWLGN